jgi:nucleoside 2-deoxyribosyltransferase
VKVYLAYQFTDEDKDGVVSRLGRVRDALMNQRIGVKCPYFDVPAEQRARFSHKQMMMAGFGMMKNCDVVLALQTSGRRSEGMLMEVGYAWGRGIPVIVATHASVGPTNLPPMGQAQIAWEDDSELVQALQNSEVLKLLGVTITA